MKLIAQKPGFMRPRRIGSAGRGLLASTIISTVLALGAGQAEAASKTKVSVNQNGKPVGTLPCETNPGTLPRTNPLLSRTSVLMGGGTDVKDAFSWMIAKMAQCADGSTGTRGNVLVIRAGGSPRYDALIAKTGPVASVITLVVPNRETAMDPENLSIFAEYIKNAGAIFLTGGDQGDYYTYWKGTPLETLISDQVKTFGIPIGGTSAGMMILSEINYVAIPATIGSSEALADPDKYWQDEPLAARDLVNDFWTTKTPFPPLLSTVTDSHFDTRARMGRLTSFLARSIVHNLADRESAQAIGVDEQTALLMECEDQSCATPPRLKVVANPKVVGAAYVLKPSASSNLIVEPGTPLTFTSVEVQKHTVNGDPVIYQIDVSGGVMTSNALNGSLY